jgi:hypothetical protein
VHTCITRSSIGFASACCAVSVPDRVGGVESWPERGVVTRREDLVEDRGGLALPADDERRACECERAQEERAPDEAPLACHHRGATGRRQTGGGPRDRSESAERTPDATRTHERRKRLV